MAGVLQKVVVHSNECVRPVNLKMSVFCYFRHHTNPVGTEWKWKMDDPDTIVNGAMENHRNMIKQFRGTCFISHTL